VGECIELTRSAACSGRKAQPKNTTAHLANASSRIRGGLGDGVGGRFIGAVIRPSWRSTITRREVGGSVELAESGIRAGNKLQLGGIFDACSRSRLRPTKSGNEAAPDPFPPLLLAQNVDSGPG